MGDLKVFAKTIEPEALEQVKTLMEQPTFANEKVRIMPDVHSGAGCVIGFTSTIGDFVIPNIVGVDIGCGVLAVNVGNIKPNLEELDRVIKERVPSGMNVHATDEYANIPLDNMLYCYAHLKNTDRLNKSLGTLGGGNHFIELGASRNGDHYLVVHTGSRNLGKQVAEYYQNLAAENLRGGEKKDKLSEFVIEWSKLVGEQSEIPKRLKQLKDVDISSGTPKGLEYLTGEDMEHYMRDMYFAQKWAEHNRATIVSIITKRMVWRATGAISSVHNYVGYDGIIRKGAIESRIGQKLIIPMNMRDGFIIGEGKSNHDWNCSAPHGAGRLMSRSKAFKTLDLTDFQKEMQGVYTTTATKETLDEAPMAYKPMEEILGIIKDTVDVIEVVKPVYNFKASEETRR